MSVLIEVCVDSTAGLAEAIYAGAGRVELCAALDLGGLTPSTGMMRRAAGAGVPIFAMIRPRSGNFVWSPDELAVMAADIEAAADAGMQGVVLGASLPDGRLDTDVLQLLVRRAQGMGLTLNRCFDLTPNPEAALEQAVDLGFDRILTSGGARSAMEGTETLARLMAQAAGRIIIMPGAGIRHDTLALLRDLPLREVHASCSSPVIGAGPIVDFGFAPRIGRRTDGARLRDLRAVLADVNAR